MRHVWGKKGLWNIQTVRARTRAALCVMDHIRT